MQPTTVAVDVAKSVFQVAISRKPGRVDEEHRLSRARFSRRGVAASDSHHVAADALAELCDEVTVLTCRLKDLERHLAAVAEQLPQVALLRTIPCIGLLNATALVACVGDVRRFPTGRHFASYLGLTPREHSSRGRAFH